MFYVNKIMIKNLLFEFEFPAQNCPFKDRVKAKTIIQDS